MGGCVIFLDRYVGPLPSEMCSLFVFYNKRYHCLLEIDSVFVLRDEWDLCLDR